MEIADEIAKRQMQPDEDAAFFQQAKNLPLPMVIASEEFKRMPVEKKRRIMTMFNQQARDTAYNETLEGTNAIGSILAAILPAAGMASAARTANAGRVVTIEDLLKMSTPFTKGAGSLESLIATL